MRWAEHKWVIGAAAVITLAGLVTGGLLVLRGGERATVAQPPPPVQLRSPFTGEPVTSLDRVLAVKIDNIVNARPQTGLTRADIVYALPVEGGLSRFLAVFSSDYPRVIGPGREHGPRHRVPVRPAAARRDSHPVGVGVLPGGLVPLHLVAGQGPLAGVDGRRPGKDR
jgi:hypothetical protein